MVAFTEASAYYILIRAKTQTRRVWKRVPVKVGNIYWAQTNRFKKDTRFARIKILDVREWDGRDISLDDARREGFVTVQEFWETYNSLNEGKFADPTRKQYIVDFEVVETFKSADYYLERAKQ